MEDRKNILQTFKELADIIITPDPSLIRAVIFAEEVSGPKSSIFCNHRAVTQDICVLPYVDVDT
jgi:hypothetical protein